MLWCDKISGHIMLTERGCRGQNHRAVITQVWFFPRLPHPFHMTVHIAVETRRGLPVATKEGDVEVIREGLTFSRYFTTEGTHPFDDVEWEIRDAVIPNYKEGGNAFEQRDVEFPVTWSQNATNIVAQKYFRGTLGTPQRESSVRQLAGGSSTRSRGGARRTATSPPTHDAQVFAEELTHLIVTQKAAFNSPVWFNVGVPDTPQQCSACFILAVDDHMSLDPQLVRRGRHDLQGRFRLGHQPVQDPLLEGVARRRRHRQRPGELHARRRRQRRHDQVRRQDPPRREDGDPERRPPRRRGLHLVQGQRGAEGARPARRRVRHGPRRQGQRARSSTRTRTTRCVSPTSSCAPSSRTRTGS